MDNCNLIYKDNGEETTGIIEEMLEKVESVLFIVCDTDKTVYKNIDNSITSLKFYDFLLAEKPKKFLIKQSKFKYFSWQGLLDPSLYDLVIIRCSSLDSFFCETFKFFYLRKSLQLNRKPLVRVFIEGEHEGMCTFFQSLKHVDETSNIEKFESKKNNLKCIVLNRNAKEEGVMFFTLKSILESMSKNEYARDILDNLNILEKRSLTEAKRFLFGHGELLKMFGLSESNDNYDHAVFLYKHYQKIRVIRTYAKYYKVFYWSIVDANLENIENVFHVSSVDLDFIRLNSRHSVLVLFDDIKTNDEECLECLENKENFLFASYTGGIDDIFKEELKNTSNNIKSEISKISNKLKKNKKILKSCKLHEIVKCEFDTQIFFKDDAFPNEYKRAVARMQEENTISYFRYLLDISNEYVCDEKGAVFSVKSSNLLLKHIIFLISKLFARFYVFLIDINLDKKFLKSRVSKFACCIKLPEFADHEIFLNEHTSDFKSQKKEAFSDVCFKIIIKMHKSGYIDNNLNPSERLFIYENQIYKKLVLDIYNYEIISYDKFFSVIEETIERMPDHKNTKKRDIFKKSYKYSMVGTTLKNVDPNLFLRKQAECMKVYGSEYYIYSFDRGTVGIAVGPSFTSNVYTEDASIEYIGRKRFTINEITLLLYYQALFFSVNYRRKINETNTKRKYHYFVLPLKSNAVDFEYLSILYEGFTIGTVLDLYENDKVLRENLLYDPINRIFYEYGGFYGDKITNKYKGPSSDLKRPVKVRQWNENFDASKLENINPETNALNNDVLVDFSPQRLYKNVNQSNTGTRSSSLYTYEDIETGNVTFHDYFTMLYKIKLSKMQECKNIVFKAYLYTDKNLIKKEIYLPGEIIFVTRLKRSTKNAFEVFIKCFDIFESLSLSFELKTKFKWDVSIFGIYNALMQSGTDGLGNKSIGYERLEFIGDVALKFCTTMYLYAFKSLTSAEIVTTKDKLICNDNLIQIFNKLDLKPYFSHFKYCKNLFQPPMICELYELYDKPNKVSSFVNYFSTENIFKVSNQDYFVTQYLKKMPCNSSDNMQKKCYADVIESIIGVFYLEFGVQKVFELLESFNFFDLPDEEEIISLLRMNKEKCLFHNTKKCTICDKSYLIDENVFDIIENRKLSPSFDFCDIKFENKLTKQEIDDIEECLSYKFKNKGYLEKAILHPSYKEKFFNREYFQRLELLGDVYLDIKVVNYVFHNNPTFTPYLLHSEKKKYVNNRTLALALFESGMVKYTKTCFEDVDIEKMKTGKISKVYSDLFEAILGAVFLDNDFDLGKTDGFFNNIFYYLRKNLSDH